jgi:hypothetical protein
MNNTSKNMAKAAASIAVCAAGVYCMNITGGATGIGWAVLGVFIIWSCE